MDERSADDPDERSGVDDDDHDHDHDHDHAHVDGSMSYAVVTVTSTRTLAEDTAGDAVVAAVKDAGDEVATRELVIDDYDGVQSTVSRIADRDDVTAVVTVGGTGVTPDDVTVEAVRPLFAKELPGFGELFRSLSFESVGTATVASDRRRGGGSPVTARRTVSRPGTTPVVDRAGAARGPVGSGMLEAGVRVATDADCDQSTGGRRQRPPRR
ncbi:molybdenum cofactor biosynthesis protein B [Halobacteriales archaeon SW_5_70_135]|nr:MAG: molybdenum cofactor biosynthesis protein B [Halobacteriales archaeon SW_5_70_135]